MLGNTTKQLQRCSALLYSWACHLLTAPTPAPANWNKGENSLLLRKQANKPTHPLKQRAKNISSIRQLKKCPELGNPDHVWALLCSLAWLISNGFRQE